MNPTGKKWAFFSIMAGVSQLLVKLFYAQNQIELAEWVLRIVISTIMFTPLAYGIGCLFHRFSKDD